MKIPPFHTIHTHTHTHTYKRENKKEESLDAMFYLTLTSTDLKRTDSLLIQTFSTRMSIIYPCTISSKCLLFPYKEVSYRHLTLGHSLFHILLKLFLVVTVNWQALLILQNKTYQSMLTLRHTVYSIMLLCT